nr:MAG: RNA-dependent RNA polymerase [Permutotetraviridae sp.]
MDSPKESTFSNARSQEQRIREGMAEKILEKKKVKKGFANIEDAIAYIDAGGDPLDFAGLSLNRHSTAKGGVDSPYQNCIPIPLLEKGKFWGSFATKIQGKPSAEQLRQLFMEKPNFRPVHSVPRDELDPSFDPSGQKPNIATLAHTTTMVRQSPQCFYTIMAGNQKAISPAELDEVRKAGLVAKRQVVASGPLLSMFQRLVYSAGRPKPTGRLYVDPDVLAAVARMLPVDPNRLRDMKGVQPTKCKWVEPNMKSGAGFPYNKLKIECAKEAMVVVEKIMNAVRDGSLRMLMANHPEWMLVKLMNKLDRYDAYELIDGTIEKGVLRQYFVFPFHWVYLFSCITQNIADASLGFWEHPDSVNAHGFSWLNGGPQKIIDWIRACKAKGPGLYGIIYSDDQLWVIVHKDGTVELLDIDWERMDLSLVSKVGDAYQWYVHNKAGHVLDNSWKAILQQLCIQAFNTQVCVEYALVYQIVECLKSGIPGTDQFDEIASTAALSVLQKYVGQPANHAESSARLAAGLEEVRKKMGLKAKPYVYHLVSAELEDPGGDYTTPWTFLGKRLYYCHAVKGWLIKSDLVRCLASILSPKSKCNGFEGLRLQMTRVRQIYASGAFTHKAVDLGIRIWYSALRNLKDQEGKTMGEGVRPLDVDEPSDDADLKNVDIVLEFEGYELPSWGECANLYLPYAKRVNVQSAIPNAPLQIPKGQTVGVSMDELAKELFPDKPFSYDPLGKTWAQLAEEDHEAEFKGEKLPEKSFEDKGASNITAPLSASAANHGRVPPIDPRERKLRDDLRRRRYKERAEAAFRAAKAILVNRLPAPAGTIQDRRAIKAANIADAIYAEALDAADDEDYQFKAEAYQNPDDELLEAEERYANDYLDDLDRDVRWQATNYVRMNT